MNIYKQELATTSKETASGYNQEVETSFTYYILLIARLAFIDSYKR